MITNNKQSKDFLKKDLPREKIVQEDVDTMWSNIGQYMEENIQAANDLNDKYLSVLDTTAAYSTDALNRLTTIASLLADLHSISGISNTSFTAFSEGVKSKTTAVTASADLLNVTLSKSALYRQVPRSVRLHSRNGTLGNSREYDTIKFNDMENIVGSHSRVEIEALNSELVATLELDLGQVSVLNTISFKAHNLGVRLPLIESIEVSEDGLKYSPCSIEVSNSQSIELDDFRFPNGMVNLSVTEFRARYVRISLVQRFPYAMSDSNTNRYAIGISSLTTSFSSCEEEGEVIFGPFKTTSQILKAAVYADVQRMNLENRNVSFKMSNDLQNWYEVENSELYDESSEFSKVLNFNNVERSSIKTENPVQELYLKVAMKSVDMSHLNQEKATVSRFRNKLTSSNKSIFVGTALGKRSVYRSEGFKFGARVSFPAGAAIMNNEAIVDFRINGAATIKSIGVEGSAVDISKGLIASRTGDSIAVQNRYDKIHITDSDLVAANPSYDFDAHAIKTYRFSKPTLNRMNIETKNDEFRIGGALPVLPSSMPAGIYYLRTGAHSVKIDMSEGFLYSNSQALYQVDSDVNSAELFNEIGEKIADIDTEQQDGLSYISLMSSLKIVSPELVGASYSSLYPLKPLAIDEYALEFGKLVFGGYFKGLAEVMPRVTKDLTTTTPVSGLNDSQRLLVHNSKQVMAKYQLLGNDLKKTIKLNHTNIMAGTIGFDISEASVNAFIKEVPFDDGTTEFRLSTTMVQIDNHNSNEITLDQGYVDDGQITFAGTVSPFQNRVYSRDELIEEGDWMIDDESLIKIILPSHIRTSDVIDTEISYNIKATKVSTSGLYSVDYERGVLYTVAPIDHRTYVNYKYSFMFAEYEALDEIAKEDYADSGSIISVDGEIQEGVDYLVIIRETSDTDFEYKASPVISQLRLNLITADDFL
jgi:hypothetical protein